jgi:hypothetical protein
VGIAVCCGYTATDRNTHFFVVLSQMADADFSLPAGKCVLSGGCVPARQVPGWKQEFENYWKFKFLV